VNDARFRDTVWDTSEFYEEDEFANWLKPLADSDAETFVLALWGLLSVV
jgi:hypothetical protein